MAGEFKYDPTNTTAIQTADPRLAKAFAEGRYAQINGGSNPHTSGSEAYTAWQAGYDTASPEGTIDNVAECIPKTVPSLVGSTQVQALAAITAAGFVLGQATYTTTRSTTALVSTQVPALAATAQLTSGIDLVLY